MDVGSTYTKGAAVDADTGELLAIACAPHDARAPTCWTVSTPSEPSWPRPRPVCAVDDVLLCSSAGGGLRLAVVGYERAVTAEAGYRVGLSAGARVVHVAAGRLDIAAVTELVTARPDVVLVVGGTDGGDTDVLLPQRRPALEVAPALPVRRSPGTPTSATRSSCRS